MVDAISAFNAYKNQMKLAQNMTEGPSESEGKPSFSDLVSKQFDEVVSTQNAAEAAKIQSITGTGDVTDLVTAIANAEMALNTIVTIRDRAISAYQDIIRMPI